MIKLNIVKFPMPSEIWLELLIEVNCFFKSNLSPLNPLDRFLSINFEGFLNPVS